MTWRIGSKRGLTLIELLVSVTILASAIVLIMQALARSTYTLSLATSRLNANTFSRAKMAELELNFAQGIAPTPYGRVRMGREAFTWHVDSAPSPDDPQLELVTLTVEWQQGRRPYASQVSLLARLPQEQP